MPGLLRTIADHPIRKKPYSAIKFVRCDGFGTPLYRVGKEEALVGAATALKLAFELFGGHCFHCKTWMPPQPLSHLCTRDHLRARSSGGGNLLHNLVLSCGLCNRRKGREELISFNTEAGIEYLRALDEHLSRCVRALPKLNPATLR